MEQASLFAGVWSQILISLTQLQEILTLLLRLWLQEILTLQLQLLSPPSSAAQW